MVKLPTGIKHLKRANVEKALDTVGCTINDNAFDLLNEATEKMVINACIMTLNEAGKKKGQYKKILDRHFIPYIANPKGIPKGVLPSALAKEEKHVNKTSVRKALTALRNLNIADCVMSEKGFASLNEAVEKVAVNACILTKGEPLIEILEPYEIESRHLSPFVGTPAGPFE